MHCFLELSILHSMRWTLTREAEEAMVSLDGTCKGMTRSASRSQFQHFCNTVNLCFLQTCAYTSPQVVGLPIIMLYSHSIFGFPRSLCNPMANLKLSVVSTVVPINSFKKTFVVYRAILKNSIAIETFSNRASHAAPQVKDVTGIGGEIISKSVFEMVLEGS